MVVEIVLVVLNRLKILISELCQFVKFSFAHLVVGDDIVLVCLLRVVGAFVNII